MPIATCPVTRIAATAYAMEYSPNNLRCFPYEGKAPPVIRKRVHSDTRKPRFARKWCDCNTRNSRHMRADSHCFGERDIRYSGDRMRRYERVLRVDNGVDVVRDNGARKRKRRVASEARAVNLEQQFNAVLSATEAGIRASCAAISIETANRPFRPRRSSKPLSAAWRQQYPRVPVSRASRLCAA